MKVLEKLAVGLAILGFIFKLFLLPGAGILLTLSLSALAVLYMLSGISISKNNPSRIPVFNGVRQQMNAKQLFLITLLCYGLAVLCMGILFKLMFFPSSQTMLSAGFMTIILASVFLLIEYRKTGERLPINAFRRTILWGAIGIVLYLTPEITLVELYYRDYPAYIEAYQNHIDNPQNEELTKKMNEEYQKIFPLKENTKD